MVYHIVFIIVILFWWSPFIPSRNLDEVFTYNHMAIMSLRNSHVNTSMFLKRAYHFLYTINCILRNIVLVRMGL